MNRLYLAAALLALPVCLNAAAANPNVAETPATPRHTPRLLSTEEARRDVALLRRALETVHPGLYRYTTKAGIEALEARLK